MIEIVRADITTLHVDAVVNAANVALRAAAAAWTERFTERPGSSS